MSDENILNKVIENANNSVVENEIQEKKLSSIAEKDSVKIYSGEAISEKDINTYFSQDFIKLIVLAGLPEYGKTTLISSIYDKFIQYGKYGNFEFTGSKTILGFEKRSYLARLKNGQQSDTRRTSLLEDNPYLDLSLISIDDRAKQRLMFFDTSGEAFKKLLKDNTKIKEFRSLLRADHFTYIFDISCYKELSERYLAKDKAKTIIRSIKDQQMFSPNLNIEIVFTKWDKITENGELLKYRNSIVNDVKEVFSTFNVGDFNVSSISDEKPFQLLDLFNYWMTTPCIREYSNIFENKTINWSQEYSKYLD